MVATRSLVVKDARTNQVADEDVVIVGSGIDIHADAAVKTLNIGTTSAEDINIGRAGQTVSVEGDLDVQGAITVITTSEFQQDATFLGNVSFGDTDSPVDDTVSFANATINSDINFDGLGHQIKNLAAPTDDNDAARKVYVDDGLDLKLDLAGGTMSGAIAMGGSAITGLAAPSDDNDAARKVYVDDGLALKVAKAGDTMSGDLAMGSNIVSGLKAPSDANDAARKVYVDDADALKVAKAGDTMSGNLAMGGNLVTGLAAPSDANDAARKVYVDDGLDLKVDLAGDTMTGSLTMSGGATVTGLPAASAESDAVSKAYAEDYFLGGAGSHAHFVQEGGQYATIQAAIDAAADGDIIFVGPKAAGWGSISLTAIKSLTIVSYAQAATEQKLCRVSTVAMNIASGLNPNSCEVNIVGLYISATVASGALVRFTGAGSARLRMRHCSIFKSGAGDAVESSNSGSGSSFYLDNCLVNSQGTAGTTLKHLSGYTLVQNRTSLDDGAIVASCAAGQLVITDCALTANAASAGPAMSVTGGTVSMGTSTINFPKVSGVGVSVASGAVFGAGQTSILVGTGLALATGKAITGAGTAIIGEVTYGPALVYSNVVDATTVAPAIRSGGAFNSALSMSPNGGTTKLKIINLANGTDANDAVNFSQLSAAVGGAAVGGTGAIQYANSTSLDGDNALLKFTEGSSTLEVKDATKTLSLTPSSVSGANGLDLNAASGQELALQVAGADKLLLAANSIAVQSGVTLSAASGGMIDLPSQFKINTTAVSATVTAANLDDLTDGSDASALHVHADTPAVVVPFNTAANSLAAGDVVCADPAAAKQAKKADADDLPTARVLGVVLSAGKVQLSGIAMAKFGAAPSIGAAAYLSGTAGELTTSVPSSGVIAEVGIVVDSTAVDGKYAVALQVKTPIQLV
jgi:hypothetical protein